MFHIKLGCLVRKVDLAYRSGRMLAGSCLAFLVLLTGCAGNMRQQPRFDPLEYNPFFPDGLSARQPVEGSIPWSTVTQDAAYLTGKDASGDLVDAFPMPVTMEILKRGEERYNIYCSPCHGYDGYGQGMIVQRGFSPPPSLHLERLRQAPVGHFYDVITNGFGRMYPYAYRVPPDDRWAIIAYIRALQRSQNASLEDLPPEQRSLLESASQESQPASLESTSK